MIASPAIASSAKAPAARNPATAPSRARSRSSQSVRTPPPAAPSRTGSRRISPSRRGKNLIQSMRPVSRPSVSTVSRVPGEGIQRVAGEDDVVEDPEDRGRGGEQHEPEERGLLHRVRDRQQHPVHPVAAGGGDDLGEAALRTVRRLERIDGPGLEPGVGEVDHVGAGEEPGLGPDQPGQREQDQHRPARARAPGLDQEGGEDEGDVGDVDVRAHAVGEHRLAGQHDRGGEQAGGPAEPALAEAVDEIGDRGERDERDRDRDRLGAVAERRQHEALECRSADAGWGGWAPRSRASSRGRSRCPRAASRRCRSWRTRGRRRARSGRRRRRRSRRERAGARARGGRGAAIGGRTLARRRGYGAATAVTLSARPTASTTPEASAFWQNTSTVYVPGG